ncbi:transposase [candidate division KSB1 bacterium]|nr:transposase [candidate division KSB1 bacterium]
MYEWRKMTPQQRKEILRWREKSGRPWHSPPHVENQSCTYHISAACYEHKPHIGFSPQRMQSFSETLLNQIAEQGANLYAWCVLPNHYHLLVYTQSLKKFEKILGKLHGRTSYEWNGEENRRGRKVWFNCADRYIRSERHFWATVNYVHHNPVHHKYVKKWEDWPFSSVREYLQKVGKENAAQIWRDYPILGYGKGWDDFEAC